MVNSMTGFSTVSGEHGGVRWIWDMRGVNGRGLDIRVRVPDGCEQLEQAMRAAVKDRISRGTVQVSLKTSVSTSEPVARLNPQALTSAIDAARRAEIEARSAGLTVAPVSVAELLSLKGVMDAAVPDAEAEAWQKVAQQDIEPLVADFLLSRAAEGRALEQILSKQIDTVVDLSSDAAVAAAERAPVVAANLRANLERLMAEAETLDAGRLEQELALLAVKSDVTEELDRLTAHTAAARELLATDGPIGRKFDFLMQEFNREANTLCSKSGSSDLTRIGLDLKTVIDQMREQVQNVE